MKTYASEKGSSVVLEGKRATIDFNAEAEGACPAAAPDVDFEPGDVEAGETPHLYLDCVCCGPVTIPLREVVAPEAGEEPLGELLFGGDGLVRTIYSDALAPLCRDLGATTTRRASHVEPCDGGWLADMTPSGGPLLFLGGPLDTVALAFRGEQPLPFPTRAAALVAEVSWLRDHDLGGPAL